MAFINTLRAHRPRKAHTSFAEQLRQARATADRREPETITATRKFLKDIGPDLTVVNLDGEVPEVLRTGKLQPGSSPPYVGFRVHAHGRHIADFIPPSQFETIILYGNCTPLTTRRDLAQRGLLMTERSRTTSRLPLSLTRLAGLRDRPRMIALRPLPKRVR